MQRESTVKMANNLLSTPTFIPQIIMVATNAQQTQTPHKTSTYLSIQTDRPVLQSKATQTQTFQWVRPISAQTFPTQTSRSVQTEHIIDVTQITDFTDTDDDVSVGTMDESLQPLQTFATTSTTSSTNFPLSYFSYNLQQPLAQPIMYPNRFEPMNSQQRAAMANAALINFFGNASTISSIM